MATPYTYTYKVAAGCEIRADVYGAAPSMPRPTIVWIHGGALVGGTREYIVPEQCGRYVDAGYVVVAIDYRLAPETKLPGIVEDLQDAFRWLRREGPALFCADPERVAVVGHSAGGYLTLMSGCCVEPPPRALVSFYGYGDIAAPWYSRPDPFYCRQPAVTEEQARAAVGSRAISTSTDERRFSHYYLYLRQQGLWPREVTGHDPDAEPAAFDRFCPVRRVERSCPPTLLLHGSADTDVPCGQSEQMAQALAQAGVEHELIVLPSAGHGFDANRADPAVAAAFERVLSFLAHHLSLA